MKMARLLGIFIRLLEEKKIYCAELAEEFSISSRTIRRDIKILKDLGLPVSSRPGKEGGYYLNESYHQTRQFLSLEDLLEIAAQLEGENSPPANREELIARIYRALPSPQGENLLAEVEFAITPSGMQESLLEKLKWFYSQKEADRLHEVIRLQERGERLKQEVKPLNLFYYQRNWFLYCYLSEKENYELISLASILNYRILDKKISSQEQQRVNNIRKFSPEPGYFQERELEVTGPPQLLEKMKEHEIFQEINSSPSDNPKCIKLRITGRDAEKVIGAILSWGSQIKILKPKWLKREVCQEAKKILAEYPEIQ